MSRREEIIHLLQFRTFSVREFADEFLTTQEVILEDMNDIDVAIRSTLRLVISTPLCTSCGFLFRDRIDRKKIRPPTKCPSCKVGDIPKPRYHIETQVKNIKKGLRVI